MGRSGAVPRYCRRRRREGLNNDDPDENDDDADEAVRVRDARSVRRDDRASGGGGDPA